MADNNEAEENEDWLATCAIYSENKPTVQALPFGGFCGSLDIEISTTNVIFARRISPEKDVELPIFEYWTLTENPVLRLDFYHYKAALPPETVNLAFIDYPNSWPPDEEREMLLWLKKKAGKILQEEELSYAVCEFVEHEALNYWDMDRDDDTGFCVVIFPAKGKECVKSVQGKEFYPLACTTDISGAKRLTLEDYAMRTITDRWQNHVTVDCPICFESFKLMGAVKITCGHFFCSDCISTYAAVQVEDLREHNDNPFRCPVVSCRQAMKIIACVKPLLSEQDMDKVRAWYKDLKNPPCWSLTQCLSKRCNNDGTVRWANSETGFVYCDACEVTWCIMCLKKVRDGHQECDPSVALNFCTRYLAASDKVKRACEEKFPWIKLYAQSYSEDKASLDWVKEHGQRCPTCGTGVERTEGCFHMKCSCGTHFCFECGDQIYAPFYGTHHCWERNAFDI